MRSSKRHGRAWLVISLATVITGILLFMWGQALGALLLPDCPDFTARGLSGCAQPRLYVELGLGIALAGVIATTACIYRRLRRA